MQIKALENNDLILWGGFVVSSKVFILLLLSTAFPIWHSGFTIYYRGT